mmetsp:Transcript_6205/g.15219  ORF Transcript_6205/g.15219 Transcript_6205/m.15219 type:complete len:213 (+) Transcript_6205:233-871(+)
MREAALRALQAARPEKRAFFGPCILQSEAGSKEPLPLRGAEDVRHVRAAVLLRELPALVDPGRRPARQGAAERLGVRRALPGCSADNVGETWQVGVSPGLFARRRENADCPHAEEDLRADLAHARAGPGREAADVPHAEDGVRAVLVPTRDSQQLQQNDRWQQHRELGQPRAPPDALRGCADGLPRGPRLLRQSLPRALGHIDGGIEGGRGV